ncbi:MAG: hypothetical protein J0L63_01085 [Anaerolineae bacterium]|jgi:hypothetical protein|nr:hypothetical protein [Chloroflexota bacterium]MBN8617464.1 hypothetical protein [Anaerolineae bacterium]HUN10569.1 hypothetical protein [Aggregatilineales bacterium]
MDHKQMCVANVQYKKPSADGAKQSKNLLHYLTYRESRDEAARHAAGKDRWRDHGMGGSVAEIAARCDALKSEHVLAFSLVTNPNPDLIAMVAPEDREAFMWELTEGVIEDFFDRRGLDTGIEFSTVLHHRLTNDLEAPGLHNPHTHTVLPGTVYSEEHSCRVPLFFSRNRKVDHIEMLHRATEGQMVALMDRYVGPEWETRHDQLADIREQQIAITDGDPHGWTIDKDDREWPVWCGLRRTSETTTSLGFYRPYATPTDDDEESVTVQFRPLLSGLTHEEAEQLAQVLGIGMKGDLEQLKQLAGVLGKMTPAERSALLEDLEPDQPAMEIDL